MANPQSLNRPPGSVAAPHVPRPRNGRRTQSTRPSPRPPDLAEVAREAVVSFLHDASAVTAEREADRKLAAPHANADTATVSVDRPIAGSPAADQVAADAPPEASQIEAQSAALRAAAISVATLDRIEATAAKVEADIAAALQAHAELQAGAGAAAEAAVSAAQKAWEAAGTAVEADKRAGSKLRLVARYAAMTTVLVVIELIIFVLFATSAH